MEFVSQEHYQGITESFYNLLNYEPEHLSDVTLVAGDKKFFCHKLILSATCPYFYTMFHTPMKEKTENEVEIFGVEGPVMEAVIRYCYIGRITITQNIAQGLLYACDMMNLPPLKDASARFLEININVTNCFAIWSLAGLVQLHTLQENAWKFCLENFCDIVNQEECLYLTCDEFCTYIQDPYLHIEKEEDVLKILVKWIDNGNEEHIHRVLKSCHIDEWQNSVPGETLLNHPSIRIFLEEKFPKVGDQNQKMMLFKNDQLLPRMFTDRHSGIIVLGNSETMKVSENKTENVCMTVIPNMADFYCHDVSIPTSLIQENEDEIMDSVSCCSVGDVVYISGIQGQEDKLWQYNVPYNQWSSSESFINYRSAHNLVPNSKRGSIYSIGGCGRDKFRIKQIEELNVSSNQCRIVGRIKVPIKWGSCLLIDEKIYLFGGEIWYNEEPLPTDLIQVYDTVIQQSSILDAKLPVPSDVVKSLIYGNKVIIMDSECTWVFDSRYLNTNLDHLGHIAKPGSGAIYFSLELIDEMLYVVAGKGGWDEDEGMLSIMSCSIESFLDNNKQVEWIYNGQLKQPLKVCATCSVKVKKQV